MQGAPERQAQVAEVWLMCQTQPSVKERCKNIRTVKKKLYGGSWSWFPKQKSLQRLSKNKLKG